MSALFLAVHTPDRFATVKLNFGVVLAYYGFSERRTLPEMMVRCVVDGLTLDLNLRDTHRVDALVPTRGDMGHLIPPRFCDRRTLTADSFISYCGTELPWKRKTSHTSATNSDITGPTSEVVTTIPDSVG